MREPRKKLDATPARRLTAALLALFAGACGRPDALPTFTGAPVVLISIDTLRADRLPAYGYAGVETPHLDRFRKDAILYTDAFSPCPMTLPSHVTMLTGLLPPEHGVRSNVGFTFDGTAHPTLPGLLRARGYATGAAVSSYVLRGETGLRAVFDAYEDSLDPGPGAAFLDQQRPGGVTASLAGRWVEGRGKAPFFYFLHLYEPHVPYDPPEPFRSRYRDAYDGEVAAADAVVGDFLDRLRRLGVYDGAVIVVTSDHGEGLGDHGEAQHSILLYREVLRVPLLLKLPGARRGGTTVEAPAQLVDLLPTLAELVGLPHPKGLRGRSLLRSPGHDVPAYAETLYPRLQLGWSDLRSLVEGRWHYIEGPRPELYDMAADPRELRDLAGADKERAARMRAALAGYPTGPATPGGVDAATAERLAALGYVGTPRERAGADLPNPRDRLPALAPLQEGFRLAAERRYDAAADVLAQVVRDSPSMVEAWVKLGEVLREAGRPAEAVAAFLAAIGHSPVPLPDVVLALGDAHLAAGHPDEAAAAAGRAAAVLPARAHELRARVALHRNRLDEAEREAVAAGPSAVLLRAEIKVRRGDPEAALSLLDEAKAEAAALGRARVPGLEAQRGDGLARLGRIPEAESAYRAEITASPGNLLAWANLAALLFAQGRRAEVEPLLEEMAAKNPNANACRVAAAAWSAFGDKPRAAAWRRRSLR